MEKETLVLPTCVWITCSVFYDKINCSIKGKEDCRYRHTYVHKYKHCFIKANLSGNQPK